MLSIRDLSVSFGRRIVLRGINMDLERGDSLAIVGESGAGKTTLGLALMGLSGGRTSGEILVNGVDLLRIPEDSLRRLRGKDIAMVFQNVEDALDPVQRVEDQVAEAILVHQSLSKKGCELKARKLLFSVGLNEDNVRAYPHQLSGGGRQRVLIAMALANDPKVLLLDEPTASLDALTREDILKLLRSALAGRISIVITHDLSLASALAENIAVLYAGRVVEQGQTELVMNSPRHPYTRGLIRSYPGMTTTRDLQGIPGQMVHDLEGCPFHERCTQRIDICRSAVPELTEKDGRLLACHRGGILPLLEARILNKTFGTSRALHNATLVLYEGETLAVVGESGSGKTTLGKIIVGLYGQDSGEILLEGERLIGSKRDAGFCSRVQMIFQNPKESISHRMSVLDAILEPLQVQRKGSWAEQLARAREVLGYVQLPVDDEFLRRYPHQLSGGEAQRVAIARALALGPKLLIADEPTSALDASVQAKILKLLMNLQERMGLAVLFITHDLALARKVSDRMAVMYRGQIVETGATSCVLAHPAHSYTRRLIDCACGERGEEDGLKEPTRAEITIINDNLNETEFGKTKRAEAQRA